MRIYANSFSKAKMILSGTDCSECLYYINKTCKKFDIIEQCDHLCDEYEYGYNHEDSPIDITIKDMIEWRDNPTLYNILKSKNIEGFEYEE